MIGLGTAALRILVALEPQDLRKGFQGLAEVALAHMAEQLGRETLFMFTNRTRTRVRLLYFDGTGLWIATKRHAPQCAFGIAFENPQFVSSTLREGLRVLWLGWRRF